MKRELLALGVATGVFLLNPHEAMAQETPATEPTHQNGSCDNPEILIEVPTGNGEEYNVINPDTGEICGTLIPPLGPFENPNPEPIEPEATVTAQPKKPVEVQGIQITRDQLPHTGNNPELIVTGLGLLSLGGAILRAGKTRKARFS